MQVRKKFGIAVITFTQPGPLGLRFGEGQSGDPHVRPVVVLSIQPESQAATYRNLRTGMALFAIGGTSITHHAYSEVIQMIRKAKKRPLVLYFRPHLVVAATHQMGYNVPITVTFTETVRLKTRCFLLSQLFRANLRK